MYTIWFHLIFNFKYNKLVWVTWKSKLNFSILVKTIKNFKNYTIMFGNLKWIDNKFNNKLQHNIYIKWGKIKEFYNYYSKNKKYFIII